MVDLGLAGIEFPSSSGETRDWLRTLLPDVFIEYGQGANVLRQLQEHGVGINRGAFYTAWNNRLEDIARRASFQVYEADRFAPQSIWKTDHDMQLNTNLVYRFKVTGTNYMTGEDDEAYFSIGSNSELLIGEAENNLLGLLAGEEEYYGIYIDNMMLDEVLAVPGFEGQR